jgi:drug/metabolite transporter (DMT)-like permease
VGMLLWALDRTGVDLATVRAVLVEPGFYEPALLAGFFGTLVALSLLTAFQRYLSPVRAAILYALEPVWAAIIAVGVGQTTIDGWLLFGGGALLLGNLFVELWPRIFGRKALQPTEGAR